MERTRLTIEVDETDLARLRQAARDRDVRLEQLTAAEFVEILAMGMRSNPPLAASTAESKETAILSKPSRETRRAAIASVHGMWRNDPSKQQDGLEYQREIRDES
ncbi:hypothetical protein NHH73_05620 [Oxalobacteraceae bacterium OTU3CINTB1]|nr:hypothetical protein NHH73_05620 [Oxalobacteraceae bacterium OTU3CINTB1]